MQQKAIFDIEAEEQESPARKRAGYLFFVLAFILLVTGFFWTVGPKAGEFAAPLMGLDLQYDSNGDAYMIYTEETDEVMTFNNWEEWHARHDIPSYLQSQPVWAGYLMLVCGVLAMVLSWKLAYRTRAAFKSSSPSRTAGRYLLFGSIFVILFVLLDMLIVTFPMDKTIRVWLTLGAGVLSGFLIGACWWRQAMLSGCCIKSGYRYDGGFSSGGQRTRPPSVYWVEAGEYEGDIDSEKRPHYPVEDLSQWREEDEKQYYMMVADENMRWRIANLSE